MKKKHSPKVKLTVNDMTPAAERSILKEMEWALKHGKGYSSAAEMHADILGKSYRKS